MKVRINGEDIILGGQASVAAVITARKINPEAVIVEYNGAILPKENWGRVSLKEADILEIVSFVGGG
ncbi:MAG: sulfur carrier protein ThiS [Candidatus Omnitrophota bacterium]|nr:sulfur carrier protein ThiS [Candidatus Omnitrophota bacterium]